MSVRTGELHAETEAAREVSEDIASSVKGGEDDSCMDENTDDPLSTSKSSTSIAVHETRMVKYSRLIAFAVIALIAILAGVATYHFVRKGEENNYKDHVSLVDASVNGKVIKLSLPLLAPF
jgi:hypothetical protein